VADWGQGAGYWAIWLGESVVIDLLDRAVAASSVPAVSNGLARRGAPATLSGEAVAGLAGSGPGVGLLGRRQAEQGAGAEAHPGAPPPGPDGGGPTRRGG